MKGLKVCRGSFWWMNAGIVLGFTLSFVFRASMSGTLLQPVRVEQTGLEDSGGEVHSHEEPSGMDDLVADVNLKPDITTAKDPKTVRILCWIMTHPKNRESRLVHVKATWSRRCDKVLYFSSEADKDFPIIKVDVPSEARSHLTLKSRQAWKYIFDNHYDDAEWFYRCDDDSYAIMDNMRYFLSVYDPNKPYYFGHMFKTLGGYSSGGSGYVISKESLKRFGEEGFNSSKCRKDGAASDQAIGACLKILGVSIGDSRDKEGRSRFHCFTPETHILGMYPAWYLNYDNYGAQK
ncbi:hypothetical protein ScPMuIL_002323, partial [Solemya velum]